MYQTLRKWFSALLYTAAVFSKKMACVSLIVLLQGYKNNPITLLLIVRNVLKGFSYMLYRIINWIYVIFEHDNFISILYFARSI